MKSLTMKVHGRTFYLLLAFVLLFTLFNGWIKTDAERSAFVIVSILIPYSLITWLNARSTNKAFPHLKYFFILTATTSFLFVSNATAFDKNMLEPASILMLIITYSSLLLFVGAVTRVIAIVEHNHCYLECSRKKMFAMYFGQLFLVLIVISSINFSSTLLPQITSLF
jgi:hypothetical protein